MGTSSCSWSVSTSKTACAQQLQLKGLRTQSSTSGSWLRLQGEVVQMGLIWRDIYQASTAEQMQGEPHCWDHGGLRVDLAHVGVGEKFIFLVFKVGSQNTKLSTLLKN